MGGSFFTLKGITMIFYIPVNLAQLPILHSPDDISEQLEYLPSANLTDNRNTVTVINPKTKKTVGLTINLIPSELEFNDVKFRVYNNEAGALFLRSGYKYPGLDYYHPIPLIMSDEINGGEHVTVTVNYFPNGALVEKKTIYPEVGNPGHYTVVEHEPYHATQSHNSEYLEVFDINNMGNVLQDHIELYSTMPVCWENTKVTLVKGTHLVIEGEGYDNTVRTIRLERYANTGQLTFNESSSSGHWRATHQYGHDGDLPPPLHYCGKRRPVPVTKSHFANKIIQKVKQWVK